MPNPMIGAPGPTELLIILAIVVLLFGAAKLPALARSTGQALRIFKDETKGLHDDDDAAPMTPPGELPPSGASDGDGQQPHSAPEQRPGPGAS